jgi:hypothetical protein
MCLEKASEKKIAEKNIFCWKKLRHNGESLIQDYKYVVNVIQPKVNIIVKYGSREIEQGYHSWVDQKQKDFYEAKTLQNLHHLFVIPKGTVYYEGLENGRRPGYTSETIVYLGHIWNPLTWLRKLKYSNI